MAKRKRLPFVSVTSVDPSGALLTILLATGESKSITFEIPASITKTGEPVPAVCEINNRSGVPLAYDVREIQVTINSQGKPEIHIVAEVRLPTDRENGKIADSEFGAPVYLTM